MIDLQPRIDDQWASFVALAPTVQFDTSVPLNVAFVDRHTTYPYTPLRLSFAADHFRYGVVVRT